MMPWALYSGLYYDHFDQRFVQREPVDLKQPPTNYPLSKYADSVHIRNHWILVQALTHTPVQIMISHRLCTVIISISGS